MKMSFDAVDCAIKRAIDRALIDNILDCDTGVPVGENDTKLDGVGTGHMKLCELATLNGSIGNE